MILSIESNLMSVCHLIVFITFQCAFAQEDCLCDLTKNACDINCFCDLDCSEDDKKAFDDHEVTRINEEVACVRKDLILTDNSNYEVTETTDGNLFCLWKDNYEERNFFKSVPTISDTNQFDSYVNQYSSQVIAVQPDNSTISDTPYKYGSVVYVVRSDSAVGEMRTIGSGIFSKECREINEITYLTEISKNCETTEAFSTFDTTCGNADNSWSLKNFFENFKVVKDTSFFASLDLNDTTTIGSQYDTSDSLATIYVYCIKVNENADCDLALNNSNGNNSAIEQFLQTSMTDNSTCSNVVKELKYIFVYSGSVITEVALEVTLGTLTYDPDDATQPPVIFSRTVQIAFQKIVSEPEALFPSRSGNPGYIRGLPVRRGFLSTVTVDNVDTVTVQVPEGTDFLAVPKPGQQCNAGVLDTTDVKFGYNTISGCSITVSYDTYTDSCASIQSSLDSALGGIWNVSGGLRLPQFGNSDQSLPGDWIEVDSSASSSLICGQATAVCGVRCVSTETMDVQGQMVVNFIDVSEDVKGAIKEIPPIRTNIPYDFFYPFLVNHSSTHSKGIATLTLALFYLMKIF
ncbi:tectonic-1-like isoform X2 [Convolutriloba macropyga]|uniref:tectonic-1-like isoform X2 n=1 Tax=Convolutriloba macropyga TaxID=536237 RepID=UPI003F52326D